MRRKKKPIKFLLLGIGSLALLSFLIYSFPPNQNFLIYNHKISIIALFLPLLFLFLFSFTAYASKSMKHGVLLGLFAVSVLSFRLTGLTHPFFFLLLAGLFLILELLFSYKK